MSEEEINNKKNEEFIAEENNNETSTGSVSEKEEAPVELSAEEKYAELNDKFLRLYSEFDNYRKRTNKEKIDLISSASAGLLKDLVPVLDDFDRAIANNQEATDIAIVKEGFNLIYTKFKSVLETKGLKQMKAKGESFDSELHEAIANIPAPDKKSVGKIIDDVEKGYYLNDKVLRYAKVVVGQ
ncbi:MAG: nucleotide exchange factor GrpE [Bacteroidota bacterium]